MTQDKNTNEKIMASSSSREDTILKHFCQASDFSLVDANVSNREKVDILRSLLFSLQMLLESKRINETSYRILHDNLSIQYHCFVDNMQKEEGLDNYSEMISVLTEGKRSESQGWVSQLSLDEGRQPLCVKNLLSRDKRETVNMKISRMTCDYNENSEPHLSRNYKPTIQNHENNSRKAEYLQNLQKPLQENPNSQSMNTVCVPRFGKRKQNYLEENNKVEKKKQINNVLYGQTNTTNIKPSNSERKKAIIYANENAPKEHHQVDHGIDNEKEMNIRNPFLTAGQQLRVDMKKSGKMNPPTTNCYPSLNYGQTKKSLGAKRGVSGKFVPPIGLEKSEKEAYGKNKSESLIDSKYEEFEWMKNIDPKMVELIENEIMDHGPQVSWNDIAGLEFAKTTIQEIVIWPMLRPDLFTGLRGPPKGLLLFGPPGTGKTLIGKCIASQSNAQFFNISASSLTSKWIGEGEKMVRALFGVARCLQPAVIFIDEIDSLLTQRSDSEHESSRRIKTEFLVQLDGAAASSEDRLLVVGATNRPQELDEAARRRLVKRLYIPLPDGDARKHIVNNLMSNQLHNLQDEDVTKIVEKSSGFSGADMANLCREAALGPIRGIADIRNINAHEVRPVYLSDFLTALNHVRPSVSQNDLQVYVDWNQLYGSGCGF